jgi:hypothetical protein
VLPHNKLTPDVKIYIVKVSSSSGLESWFVTGQICSDGMGANAHVRQEGLRLVMHTPRCKAQPVLLPMDSDLKGLARASGHWVGVVHIEVNPVLQE